MGMVLLCEDRQIGRRIALKKLRRERAANESAVARFVREARVQGQLEHPAVLPVYDLGVDDTDAIYFTMKRVRGRTLMDVLDDLRDGVAETIAEYDLHRLISAFAHVCLAVDYAHQHGVLHRDIKPANVMLGDFGEVYLVDWGLAKLVAQDDITIDDDDDAHGRPSGGETAAGALLGTPGYMSPEQSRGQPELGPPSDVYALGTILFEILARQPLHTGSVAQVLASTIAGAAQRPSARVPSLDIPPELDAICAKATAREPSERFATARALHDAVDEWLKGKRDAELRREASREHSARAAETASDTLEGRKVVMKELGRALALDADNGDAMEMLAQLFATPPAERPPAVEAKLLHSQQEQLAGVGRMAAIAYGSLFLFIPLLLWHGVRDAFPFGALFTLAAVCTAMSAYASTRPEVSQHFVGVLMLASSAMFLCLWPLYGPLLLAAPSIIANAVGFTLLFTGRWRLATIVVGVLFIAGPVLLEGLGVVSPTFVFAEGVITLVPGALDFREVPSLVLLTVATCSSLAIACVTAGAVRMQLRGAEERIYLQEWQVRAMVPSPE
jgi:serine/threonine-protein kinase